MWVSNYICPRAFLVHCLLLSYLQDRYSSVRERSSEIEQRLLLDCRLLLRDSIQKLFLAFVLFSMPVYATKNDTSQTLNAFKLGEHDGHSTTFTSFCWNQIFVTPALWRGSPSCINTYPSPWGSLTNGGKLFWCASVHFSPCRFPKTHAAKHRPRTEKHTEKLARIISDPPPVCCFEKTLAYFRRSLQYDTVSSGPSSLNFFSSNWSDLFYIL